MIEALFDKYYSFMNYIGGNSFPKGLVPNEMINDDICSIYPGIDHWKPIPSTLSEKDIEVIESYYESKLPGSYKKLLKYKHFIEFEISEISFFKFLPTYVKDIKRLLREQHRDLIAQNYLPIAHDSDYALICFDSNKASVDFEFPLVSIDVEIEESDQHSVNFEKFCEYLNKSLDDWMNTKLPNKNVT